MPKHEGVHRHGKGWRYKLTKDGHTYRESGFPSAQAASDARDKLSTQLAEGQVVSSRGVRVTVNEIIDAYLCNMELRGLVSVESTRSAAKPVRAAVGTLPIGKLRAEHIERFQRQRLKQRARTGKGNVTSARVNREVAVLRGALRLARKRRLIATIPHISTLPEDNARGGFVEPAELELVVRELPEAYAHFARFAYLVPWRPISIRRLLWTDVDLHSSSPCLRLPTTKNKRPVSVPLVGELRELVELRAERRTYRTRDGIDHVSELVFHDGGRPIKHRYYWDRARVAAGFPALNFYDLKRSAIKNMVELGVPVKTIMEIAGIKTLSVFFRYHIVDESAKRDALERTFAHLAERRANANLLGSPDRFRPGSSQTRPKPTPSGPKRRRKKTA